MQHHVKVIKSTVGKLDNKRLTTSTMRARACVYVCVLAA